MGAGRISTRGRRILLLASLPPVLLVLVLIAASMWVRRDTASYLYDQPSLLPPRQVALVLGASMYRSGKPSPAAEARLSAALALLKQNRVQRILVSGDHRPTEYDEAEAMQRWLIRAGASPGAVLLDRGGRRTFDSMERAVRLFQVREAVICTQAFHLPRAVFLARRSGIDAVGLRTGGGQFSASPEDRLRESFATIRAVLDVVF
jgi:SanA protein